MQEHVLLSLRTEEITLNTSFKTMNDKNRMSDQNKGDGSNTKQTSNKVRHGLFKTFCINRRLPLLEVTSGVKVELCYQSPIFM